MVPVSTSKAAEELRPLPPGTLEVSHASSPAFSKGQPSSAIRAATPRTRAAEVFSSSGKGSRRPRSTVRRGYPSDWIRITPLWLGAAAAKISRSTLAASTRPRWWSVWLPPSSVRPGALNRAAAGAPKVRRKPSSALEQRLRAVSTSP